MVQTYVISDGHRVKIGKSRNPSARLEQLQTGSARQLQLILSLPTDCESELHHRFKAHRITGEWFRYSFDLQRFVAERNGRVVWAPFFTWLAVQVVRRDQIGAFARFALSAETFPRQTDKLHILLSFIDAHPKRRESLKAAHREWKVSARLARESVQ